MIRVYVGEMQCFQKKEEKKEISYKKNKVRLIHMKRIVHYYSTNLRVKQETSMKDHQNTSKKVENTYKIT